MSPRERCAHQQRDLSSGVLTLIPWLKFVRFPRCQVPPSFHDGLFRRKSSPGARPTPFLQRGGLECFHPLLPSVHPHSQVFTSLP